MFPNHDYNVDSVGPGGSHGCIAPVELGGFGTPHRKCSSTVVKPINWGISQLLTLQ